MALRCELLKSSAVAAIVILHALGHCPLPAASVVALATIQFTSLFSCVMGCLILPSKQAKKSVVEKASAVTAGFLTHGTCACARALVDRADVRNAVWLMLAILLKQIVALTGFDSPLMVITLAIGLGAICHRSATALVDSGRSSDSPYGPAFWPATTQGEAPEESPLASMAEDFCTAHMTMLLPSIEIED